MCSSFWWSKETSQLNLSSTTFRFKTTDYSRNQCIWLRQRWNSITVQWWESSSLNSFLQQEHDSHWMQLSHLWQETVDHYSMFRTLKTRAWMHQVTHSDVHRSSDFEDFHEKQVVNSMSSQLSRHSIWV